MNTHTYDNKNAHTKQDLIINVDSMPMGTPVTDKKEQRDSNEEELVTGYGMQNQTDRY